MQNTTRVIQAIFAAAAFALPIAALMVIIPAINDPTCSNAISDAYTKFMSLCWLG